MFIPWARRLADYLLQRGYPVVPMTYPGVEKEWPRIRVIIHPGNTEEEINSFTYELKEHPHPQEALVAAWQREYRVQR